MTEDAGGDHPRGAAIAPEAIVRPAEEPRPEHRSRQAMRIRVIVQIERRHRRCPWLDTGVLDPEREKHRPENVEEERRGHEHSERRLGGEPLRGETNREMT